MVSKIVSNILKKEYNYPNETGITIYDAINFLEKEHKLVVSAVKECGSDNKAEQWRCFVEVIPETKGAPNRIIFQDSWPLFFDYEEVLNNCLYFYFVDQGFIPLLGNIDN